MEKCSVDTPATLITLSREDARQLFAEGEPARRWDLLLSLQEKYSEESGRGLVLDSSWHALQQALEDHASEEGNLAAARQLFANGRPLPGLEQGRQATMMRPDLVPHAARECAQLVQAWPQDDALWHSLQAVAALVDQASREGYCVVFLSGV
jgi:hypothetical protein